MKRDEFFKEAFNFLVGTRTPRERPPGALPEREFLKKCTGCDACMIACPVNVIMVDDVERRDPVIFPKTAPCVHCADYPCIAACPTGALVMTIR